MLSRGSGRVRQGRIRACLPITTRSNFDTSAAASIDWCAMPSVFGGRPVWPSGSNSANAASRLGQLARQHLNRERGGAAHRGPRSGSCAHRHRLSPFDGPNQFGQLILGVGYAYLHTYIIAIRDSYFKSDTGWRTPFAMAITAPANFVPPDCPRAFRTIPRKCDSRPLEQFEPRCATGA